MAPRAQRKLIPNDGKNPALDAAAVAIDVAAPRGVTVQARHGKDAVQYVGQANVAETFAVTFTHRIACGDVQAVSVAAGPNGTANLTIAYSDRDAQVVSLTEPWAFDASGKPLPTRYEVDGAVLRQVVDGAGASLPITFDPTYSSLTCVGAWTNLDAGQYLDLFDDGIDRGYCSPHGMLHASATPVGYTPTRGFETNVANDYGWVTIDQGGECTVISDTGTSYDFQVPCKAHDYCYDLRRTGLGATVTENNCDDWFYWLMEAHCNNRNFPLNYDCRSMRDLAWYGVSLPTNGAGSAPGAVEIWHNETGKCSDVEGPSTAAGTPIQQWSCVNVPQQEWKVHPSDGFPGWFNIVSEHSGLCMAGSASTSTVRQQPCDNSSRVRWEIRGVDYQDKQVFSLRDASAGLANCVEVPVDNHVNGQNLTYPACPGPDTVTLWMVWRMSDATP